MKNRILTRPDFDGVVCAVLLKEAIDGDLVIHWLQPNDIQSGSFEVLPQDVIANLPYDRRCAKWFDHHVSNAIRTPFVGVFRIAPSAAGLVNEYYQTSLRGRYDELVRQANKIDSATLTLDEILNPEKYPFIIISMTTDGTSQDEFAYYNHLVALLRSSSVAHVMADPWVIRRCRQASLNNKRYESYLKLHTTVRGGLSITDFRSFSVVPEGNRFLVYSLFPESYVNMKIFNEGTNICVKLGHSIFNSNCRINVGNLMAKYGGGGHRGAGACRLRPDLAQKQLNEIMDFLVANRPINQ